MNHRILIIDDNPAIHEDFRKILASNTETDTELEELAAEVLGDEVAESETRVFDLHSAYQGQEGYEMAQKAVDNKEPYALAFVDLRMPPGWDGLETIKHIWGADPDLEIVLCTAYSDYSWREILEELENPRRLLILKKPFDNIEVLQLAHSLTEKWWFGHEAERQRRLLEDENQHLRKVETFGQLAASVAHDFNNVLLGISMNAEMAVGALDDTKAVGEGLEEIEAMCRRGASLTRHLLTFSRKQVMQRRHFEVGPLVDELGRLMQRLMGEPIQLRLPPSRLQACVYADQSMIENAILNLAINARDAMPEGGTLSLSTELEEFQEALDPEQVNSIPGRFVRITITDTGGGIDPEIQSQIFEPFFTTKEAGRGTGLGLSAVKRIIEAHNGFIMVDSALGLGTRFDIYLPVVTRGKTSDTDFFSITEIRGSETILVVEDDIPVRRSQGRALRRHGYRVYEASNAFEARMIFRNAGDQIDVLVTDIVMPGGISGLDLAQELCMLKPELHTIYVSGYDQEENLENAKENIRFLRKPFHARDLCLLIREQLNTAPPEPAASETTP